MLVMSHTLKRAATVPVAIDRAREIVGAFMNWVPRLSDVATVEDYGDGIFRVMLNKIGTSIGLWSYGVHLALDVRFEDHGDRVQAVSLPRDPLDSWIGDGILLADYHSVTQLHPEGDDTRIEHTLSLRIDLPLPAFMAVVPRPLLQSVADGLLIRKTASITEEMLGLMIHESLN